MSHVDCRNDITILNSYNIMYSLRKELEQRKSDKFFGYESKMRLQKIEKASPEIFNTVISNFSLFIDTSLNYLKKWFDLSEDIWLSILPNISFKNEGKFEHFEMVIKKAKLQDIKYKDGQFIFSIRLKEIQRIFTNNDKNIRRKIHVTILKNASDSLRNIKYLLFTLCTLHFIFHREFFW
ncbi:unnamed protein product [Psylliodes chrysocephalus]|uniref:Uncharacterized protein n=1 Tax=Psylliodes chrysocephalus TaxID=3402493 RepID=A0A9P0GDG7_9CUCU|nr:unnamed protein product [Psylliodes chrysocephala]